MVFLAAAAKGVGERLFRLYGQADFVDHQTKEKYARKLIILMFQNLNLGELNQRG